MASNKRGDIRVTIAFPADIYEKIDKIADLEDRGFGQQVVHFVKIAMGLKTEYHFSTEELGNSKPYQDVVDTE